MSEEEISRRCACGFETTEFAFGVAAIGNRIDEVRIHEPFIQSEEMIKLHQDVAGHVLQHIHKIREFCDIDTTEEEKRLIKLQSNLIHINNFERRSELSDDVSFISDGIRRKLYGCASGK